MVLAALYPTDLAGTGLPPVLAQSARAARATNDIWMILTILVVASILIVAVALIVRKMLLGSDEASAGEAIFDLSELRRLHREGSLTDEEFQAARAAALMDGTGYLGGEQASASATPPSAKSSQDVELGPELLSEQDLADPLQENPPDDDGKNL